MAPDSELAAGELISPNPEGSYFWQQLADGHVVLPHCSTCDEAFFYPRVLCPRCGSRAVDWIPASGAGTLYAFCVHYRSGAPGLRDATPFATAVVDLAEGPRVMGFLLDVPEDPERIRCDVPVVAEPIAVGDGKNALAFRPVTPFQ